jgi:hypothetical protein
MNIIKGFFLIVLILGIILLGVYFLIQEEVGLTDRNKVIYKYIPRTLAEDEESPIYVSEIFKSMFTQPSVWIDSINENSLRKTNDINKYFVSQM